MRGKLNKDRFTDDTPVFDLESLEKFVAFKYPHLAGMTFTNERLAQVCNVSVSAIRDARLSGSLGWLVADRIAVNLNAHPSHVWPHYWGCAPWHFYDSRIVVDLREAPA